MAVNDSLVDEMVPGNQTSKLYQVVPDRMDLLQRPKPINISIS